MSKFAFKELVSDGDIITAKLGSDTVANSGDLNDNDIGKPVKLSAADTYNLCSDGDLIDGFLVAVEPYTADGWAIGSVQISGRKRVELDVTAISIGGAVEAAANAAANTAPTNGLGVVSEHTIAATDHKVWRLISGTATDGDTTAIIEKC